MESNIFNVLLQEKPCAILRALRNAKGELYASEVARMVNCTRSHACKILLFMEKNGFINFEKQSRIRKISLAEKGKKIAEHIEKVKELLMKNVRR